MKVRVTVEMYDDLRRALAESHGTATTKDGKATREATDQWLQGCIDDALVRLEEGEED